MYFFPKNFKLFSAHIKVKLEPLYSGWAFASHEADPDLLCDINLVTSSPASGDP